MLCFPQARALCNLTFCSMADNDISTVNHRLNVMGRCCEVLYHLGLVENHPLESDRRAGERGPGKPRETEWYSVCNRPAHGFLQRWGSCLLSHFLLHLLLPLRLQPLFVTPSNMPSTFLLCGLFFFPLSAPQESFSFSSFRSQFKRGKRLTGLLKICPLLFKKKKKTQEFIYFIAHEIK